MNFIRYFFQVGLFLFTLTAEAQNEATITIDASKKKAAYWFIFFLLCLCHFLGSTTLCLIALKGSVLFFYVVFLAFSSSRFCSAVWKIFSFILLNF